MEPITDKSKELFPRKKRNSKIMCGGNTILDATSEAFIGKNWCLLKNQSTCNALIYGKYLSNIRYALDGQYLRVHRN